MKIEDCSIVVSGESGSGKSFCTQILIQHLLSLARTQETGIVASGPILENFGHAKTRRNNNSSRVGKFMTLDFSAAGRLTGAKVEQYLLEISRVITRHPHERSFHIFYTLIYGLTETERERVGLRRPEDYEYLKHSDLNPVDEREEDDGRGIIKVRSAQISLKIILKPWPKYWVYIARRILYILKLEVRHKTEFHTGRVKHHRVIVRL